LCLSDLKLRDLAHMTSFSDATKITSPKICHKNDVTEIFRF